MNKGMTVWCDKAVTVASPRLIILYNSTSQSGLLLLYNALLFNLLQKLGETTGTEGTLYRRTLLQA